MSGCEEAGPGGGRAVRVTEMRGPGPMSRTPGHQDPRVEVPLSPAMLRSVCGTEDLSRITSLEICVDTRDCTLGNIGACLPGLAELRLNNSSMASVRDLGSSLAHLQVLRLSRCGLRDLDGIIPFTHLQELFMAYNSVSDLSQLSMLDQLQVLDLEGNDVEDLVQVQNLALCSQLHTLTLQGNPVCVRPHPTASQGSEYSYRVAVRELVPQLRFLDDVRLGEAAPGGISSISSALGEEWAAVRDAIRDRNPSQTAAAPDDDQAEAWPHSRPGSAPRTLTSTLCRPVTSPGSRLSTPPTSRPMTSPCSRTMTSPTFRPMTSPGPRPGSAAGSRPGSAGADPPEGGDAGASSLTHGAGRILFCGNPVQALRARRQKLRTAPPGGPPARPPLYVPEHTYDPEGPATQGPSAGDVLADLRAWREQHAKRLQLIETERRPEVLRVDHCDEDDHDDDDEEEDDDDDEDLGISETDESSEECAADEEERSVRAQRPASPDSASLSLSPDPPQKEALASPDRVPLPAAWPTPSPPPPPTAGPSPVAPATHRPPGPRPQRRRLLPAGGGTLGVCRQQEEHLVGAGTPRTDPGLCAPRATEQGGPLRLRTAPVPPPTSRSAASRHGDPCGEKGRSTVPHLTSMPLDRPAMTRPRTANAVLQKHL